MNDEQPGFRVWLVVAGGGAAFYGIPNLLCELRPVASEFQKGEGCQLLAITGNY